MVWLAVVPVSQAHDVITTKLTYTRDISRILARRCMSCHAAESSVPLTNYAQTRPWAVDIKQQVLSRNMPPWGAVKGFGNLSPDHGLTQEEVMIIAAWVIGGAPEGSAALLPKTRVETPAKLDLPLEDTLIVSTRSMLQRPVTLAAIRPVPKNTVGSARIIATLPDGQIEPLVWLLQYEPKWQETFRFREPLSLPAGTIVEADSPLEFALESKR